MKFFNTIVSIIILFAIGSLHARGVRSTTSPTALPQPTPTKIVTQPTIQKQPVIQPKQVTTQTQSYAQALNTIRTTMPSNTILINNAFTQSFINFVQSLNLSTIETEALLQAGANIHAVWTGNNEQDKTIASSLQNSIQSIIQNKPIIQTQPTIIEPKQFTAQPQSYAQALNTIRTTMPSNTVLINNVFTPSFINFVQSLKLSAIETEALLQAGANIHAVWTGNNEADKRIVSSLQNAIQSIIQNKSIIQTQPRKKSQTTKQISEQALPLSKGFETNNLIMILDPEINESVEKKAGAMTQTAVVALYEKASPIIMTSNVLEIIMNARQRIGNNNLQTLRAANFNQISGIAQQLAQQTATLNYLLIILLSLIDFDAINYYFHKSAPLVLLIPKQYINANLPNAATFSLNNQAQACGFNPAVFTAITDTTTNNIMQTLQQQESIPLNEAQFMTNVTSFLTPQKKDGQLISPDRDTQWAIYLTGHGGPAHQSIGTIRQQLNVHKRNIAIWRKNIAQNKNNIAKTEPIIKKYESITQGRSSWPDSQLVPESAHVAGTTMNDFSQLMKFFDNIINTAFLHYTTCFSGGSNQSFVNEVLSSLNVNFIVSSEGVHEGSTLAQIDLTFSSQAPHIRLTNPSYTEFFRLLRLFINQPEEFVKVKGPKKDPIPFILQTINPETKQVNQPFVRFPGAGSFTAISLSKKTEILTQSLVKAREIENKPINVSNTDIGILIVNPPRVNVPLNLGRNTNGGPAIVSPSPQEISPSYEAIHLFKEINFENPLQSLIFNFMCLNARMYTQTFVVNTLTGIALPQSGLPAKQGSANIHHLIIHIKGISGSNSAIAANQPPMQLTALTAQDLKYGTIGVNAHVAFEYNENIYQCMVAIKNFEDPNTLHNTMKTITFTSTPIQSINMNSLANIFLTPQEVNKLTKPITMKSITQSIDARINQQKPSSGIQSSSDNTALLKFLERKQQ